MWSFSLCLHISIIHVAFLCVYKKVKKGRRKISKEISAENSEKLSRKICILPIIEGFSEFYLGRFIFLLWWFRGDAKWLISKKISLRDKENKENNRNVCRFLEILHVLCKKFRSLKFLKKLSKNLRKLFKN